MPPVGDTRPDELCKQRQGNRLNEGVARLDEIADRRLKTNLKTFRLPADVLNALRKEAADEDSSLNSVVLTVLTKHAEWDSNAHKLGFYTVPKTLLTGLLEAVNDEDLVRFARKEYAHSWTDASMFMFQEVSIECIIKILGLAARHQGMFDVNVNLQDNEYTVGIHHSLGRKFSFLLENAFDEIWKTAFRTQCTFRRGDTTLSMRFPAGEPDRGGWSPKESPITSTRRDSTEAIGIPVRSFQNQ